MRIDFEIGPEPFHLMNHYGGFILFLVFASLTLAPLAAMCVIMAATSVFLKEVSGWEGQIENSLEWTILEALRICAQATLYFSVFFPFLVAFISTYISYHMVERLTNKNVIHDNINIEASEPSMSPAEEYWHSLWLYTERGAVYDDDIYCADIGHKMICSNIRKTAPAIQKPVAKPIKRKAHGRSWRIPQPSVHVGSSHEKRNDESDCNDKPRRVVAGGCTICLRPYHLGDRIVWSPNPSCIHTFHSDCILSWMSPWQPPNQKCPCCRHFFLGDFCAVPLPPPTVTSSSSEASRGESRATPTTFFPVSLRQKRTGTL